MSNVCTVLFASHPSTDDVTGQMIAAPPTCPGDTFTFKCTVVGNMSGLTTWRVNRSNKCILIHRTNSSIICGATFTARSGTGFGTSGPSFSSTLSGTATPALDGTLVECFGPDHNVDAGNMVGNSTLQIIGKYVVLIICQNTLQSILDKTTSRYNLYPHFQALSPSFEEIKFVECV